jgi:hypothetical protein
MKGANDVPQGGNGSENEYGKALEEMRRWLAGSHAVLDYAWEISGLRLVEISGIRRAKKFNYVKPAMLFKRTTCAWECGKRQ